MQVPQDADPQKNSFQCCHEWPQDWESPGMSLGTNVFSSASFFLLKLYQEVI